MNIIIFALALLGLIISFKIRYNTNRKIYSCPVNIGCKEVLTSQYNKTFGISNTVLGFIYFTIIAAAYSFTLFDLEPTATLRTWLILITSSAFLYSLYLTFIQLFQIKKLCTWCLLTAACSISIFVLVLISSIPFLSEIIYILMQQRDLMALVYSLGFAIGLGATTVSHVSFFRFLKDYKITKKEKSALYHQAQIVWLGILMITLGGVGLLITNFAQTISSPTAILQLIVILVLIISETIITLFISPKMSVLAPKKGEFRKTLDEYRKKAFAFSSISLVSWYLSFILNYIPGLSLTLNEHLLLYLGIIFVALMSSQIIEQQVLYRHLREESKK